MGESIVARLLARLGVALAIFAQVAFPAFAQVNNYDVIDAHGATKTMGAKGVGTGPTVLHGLHLVEGLNAGIPTPVNQTIAGQLDVNCVSGCSSGGTVTVQQPTAASLNATVVGNVGITGTLPAFAATPTFNCGTGCSAGSGTAQGATSAGVTGGLNLGLVTTAAPTYTNATVNGLSLDAAGGLRISAGALPLPAGASTSALQTTTNTKLDTLHNDLIGVQTFKVDQTTPGTTDSVTVKTQNGTLADVGSASFGGTGAACTTLTLPGAGGTYASGQGVLNNATGASVTNQTCQVGRYAAGPFTLTGARLLTSNAAATGTYRIHFYVSTAGGPTFTNGNGAALLTPHAGHFCSIDVTLGSTSGGLVFSDGADGFGVPVVGSSCTRQLVSGQVIYPVIEARGANAWLAAQTFNVFPQGFN